MSKASNYIVRAAHFGGHPEGTVISEEQTRSCMNIVAAIERGYILPTDLPVGTVKTKANNPDGLMQAYEHTKQAHDDLLAKVAQLEGYITALQVEKSDLEQQLKQSTEKELVLQSEVVRLNDDLEKLTAPVAPQS